MKAVYTFTARKKNDYRNGLEITVISENVKDAINSCVMLTGGDLDTESFRLDKIVDYELHVHQTNVVERKVLIEERSADIKVKHSGEITEVTKKG